MENAIIMASGLGTRLLPLTEKIPKPLIQVRGIPMVESIINGLEGRKVENIYIVVGYLREHFAYLEKRYSNVYLIENRDYAAINNISSVYAARFVLDQGDCFICEADLFIKDPSIFKAELQDSCYYGKLIKGHSEDWVFELDSAGYIIKIGKGGDNCYSMAGIAYLKAEDSAALREAIEAAYGRPGFERLFWDEVVNDNLDKLRLRIHPVTGNQITEIDTVEELDAVN